MQLLLLFLASVYLVQSVPVYQAEHGPIGTWTQNFVNTLASQNLNGLSRYINNDTVCKHDISFFPGKTYVGFEGYARTHQMLAAYFSHFLISDGEILSVSEDAGISIIKVRESFVWNRNGVASTALWKAVLRWDHLTGTLSEVTWFPMDPEALLNSYWTDAEKLLFDMWRLAFEGDYTSKDHPLWQRVSDDFTFEICNGWGDDAGLAITSKQDLFNLMEFIMSDGDTIQNEEDRTRFARMLKLHKLVGEEVIELYSMRSKDLVNFEVLHADDSKVVALFNVVGFESMIEYKFENGLLASERLTMQNPTIVIGLQVLNHMLGEDRKSVV